MSVPRRPGRRVSRRLEAAGAQSLLSSSRPGCVPAPETPRTFVDRTPPGLSAQRLWPCVVLAAASLSVWKPAGFTASEWRRRGSVTSEPATNTHTSSSQR
jgi:hypothetical protein